MPYGTTLELKGLALHNSEVRLAPSPKMAIGATKSDQQKWVNKKHSARNWRLFLECTLSPNDYSNCAIPIYGTTPSQIRVGSRQARLPHLRAGAVVAVVEALQCRIRAALGVASLESKFNRTELRAKLPSPSQHLEGFGGPLFWGPDNEMRPSFPLP